MRPYPLLLEPILEERRWGGTGLARIGKTLPPGTRIGESWEVADVPGRQASIITNGPLAGVTLHDAIHGHAWIMGDAALRGGHFPLLVKYLQADTNLSVQVHPSERYRERLPEERRASVDVKHEAWVVLAAEAGARLYLGPKPGVSRATFEAHARTSGLARDLRAVPVRPGDCVNIPSGLVHALGGGIRVAEVQTPSDTTFRLYDWDRPGTSLHVEEALEAMLWSADLDQVGPSARPIEAIEREGLRTTPLLDEEFFKVDRIEPADDRVQYSVVTDNIPVILMVTAGAATLSGSSTDGGVRLATGTTVLIPAGLDNAAATLERGASLLDVRPPHPARSLHAAP